MKISKIITIQSLENLHFDGLSRPKYDFYRKGNFIFILDWQSSFKWHQFQNDLTPKISSKILKILKYSWDYLPAMVTHRIEWLVGRVVWEVGQQTEGPWIDSGWWYKFLFLKKKKKNKIIWFIDKHTTSTRWQRSRVVRGMNLWLQGSKFNTH